ncbi:MAG: ankyrin repeat domain-containing protein [Elusimicrobiaceae bacterium]|nr:ankyrin repeat domain-containing protein [Elusimicrobiaceae bacterium]
MKLTLRHLVLLCMAVGLGCLAGWLTREEEPVPSAEPQQPVVTVAEKPTPRPAPRVQKNVSLEPAEPKKPEIAEEIPAPVEIQTEKSQPPAPVEETPVLVTQTPADNTSATEVAGIETYIPQDVNDLHNAVLENNLQKAQDLLDKNTPITEFIWIGAIRQGNTEILQRLLDKQPGDAQQTVGLAIAYSNQPAVLQVILDKGVNLEAQTNFGGTPLMQAASQGNLPLLQVLVEKGADVNAKDSQGNTPLMFAARTTNELAELAKKISQEPNEENALKLSQRQQVYEEIMGVLLHHGAVIDEKNESGLTALMWACLVGQARLAEVLLKNGADINLKSKDGHTALSIATEQQYTEIVDLLKKAGAK